MFIGNEADISRVSCRIISTPSDIFLCLNQISIILIITVGRLYKGFITYNKDFEGLFIIFFYLAFVVKILQKHCVISTSFF